MPLAATPPADAYVTVDRAAEVQERYPLDVYMCRECGHVQLADVVDPVVLFRDYIYTTASSPGLVEHFRQYADAVFARAGCRSDALAVDIGSNDGTLLRFLQAKGLRVQGVDAAVGIAAQATAAGVPTIPDFFTSVQAVEIRRQHGPAAIISANNVFAHADNLGDIARGVAGLLAADGLFVFEVSSLLDQTRGRVFDYVYHEHLCYHSVAPLQRFLARHSLELIDVERIGTKGGSLRCVAQMAGGPRPVASAVGDYIAEERAFGLDRPERLKAFADEIATVRIAVLNAIDALRAQGKTLAGYGASATVTTLLYHFDLGSRIAFMVDDNESRQGRLSPGMHIPVCSPQELYTRKPDAVVVLAWRFADMIIERHRTYHEQGGQFIIPLPDLRIV